MHTGMLNVVSFLVPLEALEAAAAACRYSGNAWTSPATPSSLASSDYSKQEETFETIIRYIFLIILMTKSNGNNQQNGLFFSSYSLNKPTAEALLSG